MTTLFQKYEPKNFGKEYVDIQGSDQYAMFVTTALGLKSSMDDWIPIERYEEFKRACNKYKLYVMPDVIFKSATEDKEKIIGGKNITTTFQYGSKFDKDAKEGSVHVYISKDKQTVIDAKKFGWYSVIINNRSMNKPFIDHLRFGRLLGFPSCCVDFFRKFNNWGVYSHPLETLKNTPYIKGKAIGSYYCNNFLMDHIYFYIHNLPCSYRCKTTMDYAKKVEEAFEKVEPEFVKKTRDLLKRPILVFDERHFIVFEGTKIADSIYYKSSDMMENMAKKENKIKFYQDIEKGNKIKLLDGKITIFNDEEKISEHDAKEEWFMIDFD